MSIGRIPKDKRKLKGNPIDLHLEIFKFICYIEHKYRFSATLYIHIYNTCVDIILCCEIYSQEGKRLFMIILVY